MEHWLIILTLSSGEAFPIADFATENQCYAALEEWTFDGGAKGGCMLVDDSKIIVHVGPRHYLKPKSKK
jgi:hypothetical protein